MVVPLLLVYLPKLHSLTLNNARTMELAIPRDIRPIFSRVDSFKYRDDRI